MNAPIKIAQTNSSLGDTPVQTIKLIKPESEQAITIKTGYDGKVKLDFSAIADERITIVRVGETAVIFFHDNKSTITLDPFFGSDNLPLAFLEFDLGGNRIFTAEQIAGILPFTVYQGILPAAGEGAAGNEQASGANFNPSNVEALPPIVLNLLLPPEELPPIQFFADTGGALDNIILSLLLSIEGGAVDEDGLPGGIAAGNGDLAGEATSIFNNVLVNWGGDTGAGRTIFFSSAIPTVRDQAGTDITNTLTSGGNAVNFVLLSPQLLVGYIGAAPTLLDYATNPNTVFFVEIDLTNIDAPSYTFHSLLPLDHPFTDPDLQNDGPETAYEDDIIFTLSITAQNSQSTQATATFDVLVDDDSPTVDIKAKHFAKLLHDETAGVDFFSHDTNTLSAEALAAFGLVNSPGVDPDLPGPGYAKSNGSLVQILPSTGYGADGPGSTVYSFKVGANNDSGLKITEGDSIFLFEENGVIVGRVGDATGDAAFALYIDPGNGEVSLVQWLSILHPWGGSSVFAHNDLVALKSGSLLVEVTVTDYDGDSVSDTADISKKIFFRDDGPDAKLTKVGVLDDEAQPGGIDGGPGDQGGPNLKILNGQLNFDAGADGLKSITVSSVGFFTINENSGISGTLKAIYVDPVTGVGTTHTVVMNWVAGEDAAASTAGHENGGTLFGKMFVNGSWIDVFTLEVDSTGAFVFTLYAPLSHPLQNSGGFTDSYEDLLTLAFKYTVTDGDYDTDSNYLKIKVDDDSPELVSVQQHAGSELIVNGSFEDGHGLGASSWNIYKSITGWTWGPDNIPFEVQTGGVSGLGSHDGNAHVELDGDTTGNPPLVPQGTPDANNTNATIQQIVGGTVAGQTYELSFWYAPRGGEGVNSSGMKVFFEGNEVFDIPAVGNQYPAGQWTLITVLVTATGPDALLAFTGTGPQNEFGAFLDNVSLKAVVTLDDDDTALNGVGIPGGPGDDGNGVVATGKINFNPGADGLKSIVIDGMPDLEAIWVDGNGVGHPQAVSYDWQSDGAGGGTLTGKTTDLPQAFTIVVDAQGNYTFTLIAPLVHPLSDNPDTDEVETSWEDNLILEFPFTITDGDGDKVSGTLLFNVDDDSPTVTVESICKPDEPTDHFPRWPQDLSHIVFYFKHSAGDTNSDGYYLVKFDDMEGMAPSQDLDDWIEQALAWLIANDPNVNASSDLLGVVIKGGTADTKFFAYGSHNQNGADPDTIPVDAPQITTPPPQGIVHGVDKTYDFQTEILPTLSEFGKGDDCGPILVHDETKGVQVGTGGTNTNDQNDVLATSLPTAIVALFAAIGNPGSDPDIDDAEKDDLGGGKLAIGVARSGDDVNANAPVKITVNYGADGAHATNPTTFMLVLGEATEGLVDSGLKTTENEPIYLFKEGDLIVGRVNDAQGTAAFAFAINPETGEIYSVQWLSIFHAKPGDGSDGTFDEIETLIHDSIKVEVTVKDGDGDTVASEAISIGKLVGFQDDGPVILGVTKNSVFGDDLMVNGSFEEGHGLTGNQWNIYQSVTGWTWGPDNIPFELQRNGVGGLASQNGVVHVELDGDTSGNPDLAPQGTPHPTNTNATIQQIIPGTVAGQIYELSFWYAPRPGQGTDSSGLKVSFGGVEVYNIDPTPNPPAGWQQITIIVTATGPDTVLAFTGTGSENEHGAFLDKVSLRAVYGLTLDDEDTQLLGAGIQGGPGDDGFGVTATGQILFDAGSDGLKSIVVNPLDGLTAIYVNSDNLGVAYGVNQTWEAGVDAGGVAAGFEKGGTLRGTMTTPDGDVDAFTLEVDTAGNYTFTLIAPLNHPLTHDGNPDNGVETSFEDNLVLDFGFVVTDGDGDTAWGTLTFNVDDDSPTASNLASQDVAEGATVTGTLPFITGADGASVTHINDSVLVFDPNDNHYSQAIDIGYGLLKVKATGEYSFTADNPTDSPVPLTTASFTVTDGDGDMATGNIAFQVIDANVPTGGSATATVDDDGLSTGNSSSNVGDIDANIGDLDGPASSEASFRGVLGGSVGDDVPGVFSFANLHLTNGSVGPETVQYTWSGDTLTATITNGSRSGEPLFRVQILDESTGEYRVTLLREVHHTEGPNDENNEFTSLIYTITDSDNSSANGTLHITFNDDTPTAVDDVDSVTEDGPTIATGNVASGVYSSATLLTPDDENDTDGNKDIGGADGFSKVIWQGAVGGQVAGAYGTLRVDENGNYVYELNDDLAAVQDLDDGETLQEVFSYSFIDGDGDASSATLTITINGVDDILPLVQSGTFLGLTEEEHLQPASGTFPITAEGNEDDEDFEGYDTDEHGPGFSANVQNVTSGTFMVTGGDGSYIYKFAVGINDTNVLKSGGGNLTSGGDPVLYHVLDGDGGASDTLIGYVNTDGTDGYQPGDQVIFSMVIESNGDWTFTLFHQVDHPVQTHTGPASEETIAINFNGIIIADDEAGNTLPLEGEIRIIDDVPVAVGESVDTIEGGQQTVNLVLIIDRSGSMNDDPDGAGGFANRLALAKAALINLINTANVQEVLLVPFASSASNSGWITPAAALAAINALTVATAAQGQLTNFDAALAQVYSAYGDGHSGTPADKNFVFFISDGVPNLDGIGGGNTNGIQDSAGEMEIQNWQNFVVDKGIDQVFAIGAGAGSTTLTLDPIAYPNGDPTNPVVIVNETELINAVTSVLPGIAHGNILANGDSFGADGGHILSIQVIEAVGVFTYVYDPDSNQVQKFDGNTLVETLAATSSITAFTAIGGKLIFHFADGLGIDAGEFTYNSPGSVAAPQESETFPYVLVDGDGDQHGATLTVNIDPNTIPTADNDSVITNSAVNPVVIPFSHMLDGDEDLDGHTLLVYSVQNVQGGTATIVGTTVVFTPGPFFTGGSFEYTIIDGFGGEATATVNVIFPPSIHVTSFSVDEDTLSGHAAFSVFLSHATAEDISFDLALAPVGANPATGGGVDYGSAGAGNLQVFVGGLWVDATSATIPAGALQVTVRTPINDDDLIEETEQFTLAATVTAGNTSNGSNVGTASIIDDDTPPNTSPVINAPATIFYSAENQTSAPVTFVNRLSIQDADGNATVRLIFTALNTGTSTVATSDTWVANNLAGFGLTQIANTGGVYTVEGTYANLNAWIKSNGLAWNPGGTGGGGTTDRDVRIDVDTNLGAAGGIEATHTITLDSASLPPLNSGANTFIAIGWNFNKIADIDAKEQNDTIVTSWSHGPDSSAIVYKGGNGSGDKVTVVFTPAQLEQILTGSLSNLTNFMNGASDLDLDSLNSPGWNGKVTEFETEIIGLAAGPVGYVETAFVSGQFPTNVSTSNSISAINGTSGNDLRIGGAADNIINGLGGNDILVGLGGNDTLNGGDGNDLLLGGAGDDILDGGTGKNLLSGGTGADTFKLTATDVLANATLADVIVDYSFVEGDKLDLTGLLNDIYGAGHDGTFANVRLDQSGSDVKVQVETGSSGSGIWSDVAVLAGYATPGADPVKILIDAAQQNYTA